MTTDIGVIYGVSVTPLFRLRGTVPHFSGWKGEESTLGPAERAHDTFSVGWRGRYFLPFLLGTQGHLVLLLNWYPHFFDKVTPPTTDVLYNCTATLKPKSSVLNCNFIFAVFMSSLLFNYMLFVLYKLCLIVNVGLVFKDSCERLILSLAVRLSLFSHIDCISFCLCFISK